MMSQVVSRFPHPEFVAMGLIFFLCVFVGAAIWIFRRGSAEIYRRMEKLPFDKSEENRHE